jgi:hypothetical protein
MKAAKFRQWYENMVEIFKEDPAKRAIGSTASARDLLSRLERIGLKNGAVEYADFPTSVAGEWKRRYRLKQDFDWKNGTIDIGLASWADATGPDGFISEVERATGIPEHD